MAVGFVQFGGHGAKSRAPARTVRTSPLVVVRTVATPPEKATAPPPAPLAPPPGMYDAVVELGAKNGAKPAWKIFLSSILGGAYIGYGALLALAVGGACPGLLASNPGLQSMVQGAFGLPFGLMMVIITGAELFTGNTMTLTTAYHEGRVTAAQVAKSWIFSFLGNFLGSMMLVYLCVTSGLFVSLESPVAAAKIKTSCSFMEMLVRGILCNWLVTAGVYMASGAKDLAGKIVAIWFPISAFVALKFEHSVANMFMVPMGIGLGAGVTFKAFLLSNLLPVTIGNIIGGAVLMATANSYVFGSLGKEKPKSE